MAKSSTNTEAKSAKIEQSTTAGAATKLTRDEVAALLTDIGQQLVSSSTAYTHSMVMLNNLLRNPDAVNLFDKDLKEQAKDLWLKIKSTGLQLVDPPFLFGLPADFDKDSRSSSSDGAA